MNNTWLFNNPYIYLIVENNKHLPVYIHDFQMVLTIFFDYESAKKFNNNFLSNNNTKIVAMDTLNGIRTIENYLISNSFIPQIGVYDDALIIYDSKKFIENFYKYQESYNHTLNELINKKVNIDTDTLILLLINSPLYVVVPLNAVDTYYKVIQDAKGNLLGIQQVGKEQNKLFLDKNKNILIFSNKELFENYKSNKKNITVKKYWGLLDILDNTCKDNLFENIIINSGTLNQNISLEEIYFYLQLLTNTFENN